MKSLPEAPEHDEGLGRERAGGDGAVRALVASSRTLAAETPAGKLPARASVTAHARHAPALAAVELAPVTWNKKG